MYCVTIEGINKSRLNALIYSIHIKWKTDWSSAINDKVIVTKLIVSQHNFGAYIIRLTEYWLIFISKDIESNRINQICTFCIISWASDWKVVSWSVKLLLALKYNLLLWCLLVKLYSKHSKHFRISPTGNIFLVITSLRRKEIPFSETTELIYFYITIYTK